MPRFQAGAFLYPTTKGENMASVGDVAKGVVKGYKFLHDVQPVNVLLNPRKAPDIGYKAEAGQLGKAYK